MKSLIVRLVREDEGQDLVEYVLLVALIALAVAAAFPPISGAIQNVFRNAATQLGGGGAAPAP
jgi:pilus assembly protein Flp/PilA